MAQDTNVENLIINKLTKAQYESITNPDPTQLYFITDEGESISTLDDVSLNNIANGQILKYNATTQKWENNDGTISAICRNVGEIISSTLPLTDAGLHLLDGTLLQYGIYKEFIDYIAELYTQDPTANYFTTEALWQQSVTTYGVCGKFVYDSVNNTVRLPKYSNKIYTQELDANAPVIGNGAVLGFTSNKTDFFGLYCTDAHVTAQSELNPTTSQLPQRAYSNQGTPNGLLGVSTDPTKSGIIAQLSDITTSLDGYYYIVIATTSKTDVQVDIDKVATDLNGKADTDLSNVTDTAKVMMSGMAMPSNKYIALTLGASGTTYTAPANGWFCLQNNAGGANPLLLNNQTNGMSIMQSGGISGFAGNTIYLPCSKGDIVNANYTSPSGSTTNIYFIYAQGSKSEVQ